MIPGIVYLIALVLGGGTVTVQLLMSGHGDVDGADAAGGGDLDGPGGADGGHEIVHTAQLDLDANAPELDGGTHHAPMSDVGGLLPLVLSLRFWTFALLAFGLVGSVLHFLRLGSDLITPLVSIGTGVVAGLFASWSFKALAGSTVQSGAEARDAVGQLGRVLIPLDRGSRGKVRIRLKGQDVDYVATTDEELLASGDSVLVEEVREGTVHVSRAPGELLSATDSER
jgi:membrane protein implicated in regulation of membrane protease activity